MYQDNNRRAFMIFTNPDDFIKENPGRWIKMDLFLNFFKNNKGKYN